MSERPTPETDAEHAQFAMGGFTLDFCRKLERERDEAREKLNTNLVDISNKLVVAIKERDEAIARSKEWSDWCVEYKSERDELQEKYDQICSQIQKYCIIFLSYE